MVTSKSFLTVASVAVALMFGGGVLLLMNLGSIAKQVTERVASDTLGVRVSIVSMDISLPEKTATVTGLKIANPDGFKKSHALTVDTISVTLENVSQELIEFKNIAVEGTNVNLEVKENSTNLNTIKSQIKTGKPPAKDPEKPPLKVIIDRMAMTDAQLNPSVTLLGDQELTTVEVPDIILTGIGRRENGVLVKDAIAQVWNSVTKAVNKSAGQAGFFQGMSTEALEDMGMSQIQQLKDSFSEDVNKLGDGIKGLFGD